MINLEIKIDKKEFIEKLGVKDGRDGADGKDGKSIVGPAGKDGRDGVPDMTEIEKLQKEIETLKTSIANISRGRGGARGRHPITNFVDLTSSVNGSATTFTLPMDTVKVHGVFSTQFPQVFNTTDWSFAGRTLTLNFTLQSGQTLIAVIEQLFY